MYEVVFDFSEITFRKMAIETTRNHLAFQVASLDDSVKVSTMFLIAALQSLLRERARLNSRHQHILLRLKFISLLTNLDRGYGIGSGLTMGLVKSFMKQ